MSEVAKPKNDDCRHTPGPWTVAHKKDAQSLVMSGEKVVATCDSADNARLIAAAPDLLDALTKLQEAMYRYEECVGEEAPPEHYRMMNDVADAIKKATSAKEPFLVKSRKM